MFKHSVLHIALYTQGALHLQLKLIKIQHIAKVIRFILHTVLYVSSVHLLVL